MKFLMRLPLNLSDWLTRINTSISGHDLSRTKRIQIAELGDEGGRSQNINARDGVKQVYDLSQVRGIRATDFDDQCLDIGHDLIAQALDILD
ncbi:MAG: hypothetical protein SCM11_10520 [Bacillota bacterium]|nr:hypothetical protein [Bacillota bacterium]